MKLDLERSLKAPFRVDNRRNLIIIYLVAFGITIFPNIIQMILNFIVQMGMGPVFAIASSSSGSGVGEAAFSTAIGVIVVGVALVLMFISFLIGFTAYLLSLGYLLETIHLEVEGHDIVMPLWEGNIKKFLVNGLKLMGILIIYILISFIIILVPLIVLLILAFLVGGSNGLSEEIAIIAITVFSILCFIVILPLSLICPMMMVHFAVTKSFWAGLNIIEIVKKVLSNLLEYILAIIIVMLYSLILMIPIFILCCTCVGVVFIPLVVNFILPIVTMNLFAQLYKTKAVVVAKEDE